MTRLRVNHLNDVQQVNVLVNIDLDVDCIYTNTTRIRHSN